MENLDFSAESFKKEKAPKKEPTPVEEPTLVKDRRQPIDRSLPLVEQAIEAYKMFLSDSFAFDYIGLNKAQRTRVLDDPQYRIRTKQIRAESYLWELDEIDGLSITFQTPPSSDYYDLDNTKEATKFENDKKSWLAGKLKVAELRRDLRQMSRKEDEAEESDSLNIFFVPISREEFDRMETVEVFGGTDDGIEALAEASADQLPVVKAAMEKVYEDRDEDRAYKINADGTVEDW